MTNYILRSVNSTLWKQAKKRAEGDGHTLRWTIIRLLELYVAGNVSLSEERKTAR